MSKLISKIKILQAPQEWWVELLKTLLNAGYGDKLNGGSILTPSRKILDLEDPLKVQKWFTKNKPSIVIIAASWRYTC